MTDQPILPYDQWIDDALRGVVRRALRYTSMHGLPGAHHFYVSFSTVAPGVEMPVELRARFPEEMTIVLQYQFTELEVEDDYMAVTLKFGGRASRLRIPFPAINSFGDPSVNFGLQLRVPRHKLEAQERELADEANNAAAAEGPEATEDESANVISLDTFRKK